MKKSKRNAITVANGQNAVLRERKMVVRPVKTSNWASGERMRKKRNGRRVKSDAYPRGIAYSTA